MPVDAVINIVISGLLTGLVYGLMALGLSVIYGVVRIVNFAHGEMMTMAMYATVLLFATWHLDPLWMLVPVVLAFFAFGYVLQRVLVNPFIDRPEHSQFMLLLAVALVLVNGLLIAFGPDARNVQVDYALGARVVGLNVPHLYALTFGLGTACVAAAGVLMTLLVDVTPISGPGYTLLAFIIVIIGGLGSMVGALVGGV